ncbi:uncharacterized protein LOC113353915 [Papaver somniferum]|uniref:uncharacterized protein LOC113353915 n=1 Tax=Papaver somniferum TaxID=3469 RepID=UPI000E6FDF95|nr:uncharacterized protein LOC113353915 [Papaver somniferum]
MEFKAPPDENIATLLGICKGRVKRFIVDFGLIPSDVGAGTTTLILAFSWAGKMDLFRVIFVSDCLQLVNFLNGGKGDMDWWSMDLLEECRISLSSCMNIRFFILSVLEIK